MALHVFLHCVCFTNRWHTYLLIILWFSSLATCRSNKAMAPHSSTLAWKIPWTEEAGGLQSMGSLRVGYDWATSLTNRKDPFNRTLLLLLLLSHFSRVRLWATPWKAAHQPPTAMGFSRQEHWSGSPFPSPMQESEKWKWSRLVVSDS